MFSRRIIKSAPSFKLNGFIKKNIHQSSLRHNSKVYELRVYQIKPESAKPFMELSKEWLHLRTQHSVLIGYWTSEIGGINDMVHIWEYDSLDHRAKVRQALANDASWIANYFGKILPMMSRQENSLLVVNGELNLNQQDLKGVYELEVFNGKTVDRPNDRLLGSFTGLIGPLNTACNLWFHKSVDDMVNSLKEVNTKQGSTATGHSRLLMPTPWSPLK